MRKVVSHLFITLDGVAQLDTIHGLVMSLIDEELNADTFEKLAQEDAMILGCNTYQQWVPFWPTSELPYAAHINAVPKYVASKTLDSFPWGNLEACKPLTGSLVEAIDALKRQPGKNIGVHGSPTLVGAMLQENLIDELRLAIYPILAGAGPRLFQDRGVPKQLALVDSKVTSKGVAIMTYHANAHPAAS